jgi:hypothetical protein
VEITFAKLGFHVKPFFADVSKVPECLHFALPRCCQFADDRSFG